MIDGPSLVPCSIGSTSRRLTRATFRRPCCASWRKTRPARRRPSRSEAANHGPIKSTHGNAGPLGRPCSNSSSSNFRAGAPPSATDRFGPRAFPAGTWLKRVAHENASSRARLPLESYDRVRRPWLFLCPYYLFLVEMYG